MINLKKQDPVADAVKDILQQESLKGNQTKIDKNHNGKIDGQDFKILRGEKKTVKEEESVDEGVKEIAKKAFKALTGGSDKDQLKDLQRKMNVPQTGKKPSDKSMGEEVEQIEEGGIGDLPNRGMMGSDTKGPFGVYHHDGGPGAGKLKIVSKHKTLDSALKHVDKLTKKSGKNDHFYGHLSSHGPDQGTIPKHFHEEFDQVQEVAPPGFEGTVKAMKKHKDIDNPWALAWSMKNKGYKSHKKADGSPKNEEVEQLDELSKSTLGSYVKSAARDVGVSRKLSADFENRADKSRNASSKTANSSISKRFNDIAKKRQSGIGQAVERLTKEEVMPKTLKQFKENAFDWKKKPEPTPNGGSGVKQGSRYGGSKQKDEPEKDTDEKK